MKNIAIIPARSGSKGLKDKNIKLLDGKPLIWYSIQAALDSNCFDEVMVSTDSEKYVEIAKKCGANVPFLRSERTSTDKASSWDTVREVLVSYKNQEKVFDNVMLLQPTSPLRNVDDIKNAFALFENNHATSVVGVCEMEHSPLWSNTLPFDKRLDNFINSEVKKASGRQSLPTYYRINGAVYLSAINYENMEFDLFDKSGFAYVMPQERSIDIDSELDFVIAETIIKRNTELRG